MPVVAFGISFHVTKVVFVRQFTHSIQIRTCTSWVLPISTTLYSSSRFLLLSNPLCYYFTAFSIFPLLFCSLHVLRLYLSFLEPLPESWLLFIITLVFAVLPSISSVVRSVSSLSFGLLMLPAAILAGSKPQTAHGPWASFLWPSPWARGYTANFILNAKLEASLQSRLHKSQCLFELQCWVTMVEWHLMSLDSVRFSLKVKDLDPDYTPVLTWSSPRRRTISCHSNFVC